MGKMADVRDILELERSPTPEVSKEVILGLRKDVPKRRKEKEVMRRPEGMHRELYALLYSDSNKDLPPLLPTDSGKSLQKNAYFLIFYMKLDKESSFQTAYVKFMKTNKIVEFFIDTVAYLHIFMIHYDLWAPQLRLSGSVLISSDIYCFMEYFLTFNFQALFYCINLSYRRSCCCICPIHIIFSIKAALIKY